MDNIGLMCPASGTRAWIQAPTDPPCRRAEFLLAFSAATLFRSSIFFQLLQPLQPFNFPILSLSTSSTVRRRSLVRPETRIFGSAGTETPRIGFLFSRLDQIINRPRQYGAIRSEITQLTVYVEHHGAPCRRRAPICCRLAGDIGRGQWHCAEVCLGASFNCIGRHHRTNGCIGTFGNIGHRGSRLSYLQGTSTWAFSCCPRPFSFFHGAGLALMANPNIMSLFTMLFCISLRPSELAVSAGLTSIVGGAGSLLLC